MGRKFSFDLRLKLGQGKSSDANNANANTVEPPLESPPLEYQSLAPPLSAEVDAELRAACAYVAQDYKPSEQIYEEQNGNYDGDTLPSAPADFAAVSAAIYQHMAATAPPPPPAQTQTQTDSKNSRSRSRPLFSALEDFAPDAFGYRSVVKAQNLQRPETGKSEVYFKGALIQQSQSEPPTVSELSPEVSSPPARPSHSRPRSIPLPVYYPPSTSKNEHIENSKTAQARSGSVDFTPRTDVSDYPWSTSTAPTSAPIVSTRSSKRGSSQALQTGVETNGVRTADAEWMHRELERYKKLQEARAQLEAQAQLIAGVLEETALSARAEACRPARRSIQRSGTTGRQLHRSDSTGPQQMAVAPAEDPSQDNGPQQHSSRAPSRQSIGDVHERGRGRSFTQEVKHYFRLDPAEFAMADDNNAPRTESRRSSLARRVQDYIRPRSSRRTSVDRASRWSRAPSVESGVSINSVDSANWWRSWKPWYGRRGESPDTSRPESSGFSFRGRAPTRDDPRSGTTNGKPAIDLNRELPPLPSLDQWKDTEVSVDAENGTGEPPEPPENNEIPQASVEVSQKIPKKLTKLRRGQSQNGPVKSQPILYRSRPSNDVLPVDSPDFDAHNILPSDYEDPTSPVHTYSEANRRPRRRSRSIHVEYPPEMAERIRNGDFGASSSNGTLGLNMSSPHYGTRPPATSMSSHHGAPRADSSTNELQSRSGHTRTVAPRKASESKVTPPDRDFAAPKQDISSSPSANASSPSNGDPPSKRKWWQSRSKKSSARIDQVDRASAPANTVGA